MSQKSLESQAGIGFPAGIRLLDAHEVGALLRVHPSNALPHMKAAGCFKRGKKFFVLEEDFHEYLRSLRRQPESAA